MNFGVQERKAAQKQHLALLVATKEKLQKH
jgi:hypothetical protein